MANPVLPNNLVDHFPQKEALDLAASVSAGLEAFKNGEVILRHLTSDHLRQLLGRGADSEVIESGLRFKDTTHGIESYPNFAGKNPFIDKDDPSDTARGVAKITTPSAEYNIDLIIEKFDLGSNGLEYALKLIPDANMDESLRQKYLTILAKLLKKETGV